MRQIANVVKDDIKRMSKLDPKTYDTFRSEYTRGGKPVAPKRRSKVDGSNKSEPLNRRNSEDGSFSFNNGLSSRRSAAHERFRPDNYPAIEIRSKRH